MSEYQPVIGLEIHAQLLTRTKMFCACPAGYGADPNTNICPVCLGLPGALPTVNARAVEFAVRAALALDCTVARRSVFARKNYFYPDCPKNYQITQYETPLATGGRLELGDSRACVRIKRIHLEEDAGKLLHPEDEDSSYVDMNRAGVPLAEIVTEPDIRSPADASLFVQELRSILQYIEICDGNMEQGSLRCDANVSLQRAGRPESGVSTEIKNLNSFKFIEHALDFEIGRQTEILRGGGLVEHATLLWDERAERCQVMRTKEETREYRYFPEPDLPPLVISDALVERLGGTLPELPSARADRFASEYELPRFEAVVLTGSRALADYFEAAAKESSDPREVSRWIVGEVLHVINERKITIDRLNVSPKRLSGLISEVSSGRINRPTAKKVFEQMVETGGDPGQIISDGDLGRITDGAAIAAAIERVLDAHPEEVTAYLGGKEKVFIYFVGQVMRETRGRADPALVNERLRCALEERRA